MAQEHRAEGDYIVMAYIVMAQEHRERVRVAGWACGRVCSYVHACMRACKHTCVRAWMRTRPTAARVLKGIERHHVYVPRTWDGSPVKAVGWGSGGGGGGWCDGSGGGGGGLGVGFVQPCVLLLWVLDFAALVHMCYGSKAWRHGCVCHMRMLVCVYAYVCICTCPCAACCVLSSLLMFMGCDVLLGIEGSTDVAGICR